MDPMDTAAAEMNHGYQAIRINLFNNGNMGDFVISTTIFIAIKGIVKKRNITRCWLLVFV